MKHLMLLLATLALSACELDFGLDGLCLDPDGCLSSDPQINYVYAEVTIQRGGLLVPDTVRAGVTPSASQQPVITWTNADTVAHHLISDAPMFEINGLFPNSAANVVFTNRGTYSYHCINHPTMKGVVIIPWEGPLVRRVHPRAAAGRTVY